MEREVVIGNKALEELRKRLERWGELCAQLRELYHRYLDLAAFRSEKCYFPGRRCRRSWKREYDAGDLTLMWTYIANTAPLCGKLMRALAEVEYEVRKRALENFEKYGGLPASSRPKKQKNPDYKVEWFNLNSPVYAYAVIRNGRLYVIWGEFDNLPRKAQLRTAEIERRIRKTLEDYERGETRGHEIWEFDISGDVEYEAFFQEVPLPETASKMLNGRNRAPVALFRNLGWLASDDSRHRVEQGSDVEGQTALRLLDWIALAKYVIKVKGVSEEMLVFKLKANKVVKTKRGYSVSIMAAPIGFAAEVIKEAYNWFGIRLGRSREVLAKIYALVKALRMEAFGSEGGRYVVSDVGAWIAWSSVLNTMILGDGHVLPCGVWIAVKSAAENTLEGPTSLNKELAEVVGGSRSGGGVALYRWHIRLLLPAPPFPAFEKSKRLYRTITEYPLAAILRINGKSYMVYNYSGMRFAIGREKGAELYEAVSRLGVVPRINGKRIILTFRQLIVLRKRGIAVKFLNELEKENVRRVRPVLSLADAETVRHVLEELLRMARVVVATCRGRVYIRIIPYDSRRIMEIVNMLQRAGIRVSIIRKRRKELRVYERNTVAVLVEILRFLQPHSGLYAPPGSAFGGALMRQPLYISFV